MQRFGWAASPLLASVQRATQQGGAAPTCMPADNTTLYCNPTSPAGWSMLDDGGSGQAVEVISVSEDAEHFGGVSPTITPRAPGTPGILATAHVRTKVQPPAGGGLSGIYAIVRRFEFSAEKQRNVVVVRKPDGSLHVMAKGSPEMMRKLSGRPGGSGLSGLRVCKQACS